MRRCRRRCQRQRASAATRTRACRWCWPSWRATSPAPHASATLRACTGVLPGPAHDETRKNPEKDQPPACSKGGQECLLDRGSSYCCTDAFRSLIRRTRPGRCLACCDLGSFPLSVTCSGIALPAIRLHPCWCGASNSLPRQAARLFPPQESGAAAAAGQGCPGGGRGQPAAAAGARQRRRCADMALRPAPHSAAQAVGCALTILASAAGSTILSPQTFRLSRLLTLWENMLYISRTGINREISRRADPIRTCAAAGTRRRTCGPAAPGPTTRAPAA